jgi:hypothetical protein
MPLLTIILCETCCLQMSTILTASFKITGARNLGRTGFLVPDSLFLVSFYHSFSCVSQFHQAVKILSQLRLTSLRWPETIACSFSNHLLDF